MRLRATMTGLAVGVAGLACSDTVTPPEPGVDVVVFDIVSGDQQTGAVGQELPGALVVRATDDKGKGIKDQLVNFRVLTGGGSVFAGTAITDDEGFAQDYWMLGPSPGMNTVEVRSVDPTTGEKHVFASFAAWGIIPGPEVCNGIDDDLNGTADDGLGAYCLPGGIPAANTDGDASCLADYGDPNGDPADGCEIHWAGVWTLSPAVALDCTFALGTVHISTAEVTTSPLSSNVLSTLFDVSVSYLGVFDFDLPGPDVTVDGAGGFGGAGAFTASSSPLSASGNALLVGAFTATDTFSATLEVSFSSVTFSYAGLSYAVQCDNISEVVTGTHQ